MKENKITICTHSSKFHTDDVFAVATLQILLDGKDVEIVRSRDIDVIQKADFVVDVGGVYDPKTNRFDHHQEGGAGTRENSIPYASFGLVWKTYGQTVCGGDKEIADAIDVQLVQPIDAHDNAIVIGEVNKYGIYPYDLKSITDAFGPTWKEGEESFDTLFFDFVLFVKKLLLREIKHHTDDREARNICLQLYKNATDKRLIVADRYYPWGEIMSDIPEPLFVVFPRESDNTWSIKTIRDNMNTFEARKDLPKEWAGKRDADFEKISGVPGAVFCHNNRFLAVAKTKEAILKLAEIALNS